MWKDNCTYLASDDAAIEILNHWTRRITFDSVNIMPGVSIRLHALKTTNAFPVIYRRKTESALQRINAKDVAALFKALTEPRRILILKELQKREHCVCDFVEILGLSQPAVSHHISLLSRVGLIKTRKEGTKVICSLKDKENLDRLFQIAEKLIR